MKISSGPSCGGCCTKLVGFGVQFGDTPILKDIDLHVHCGELTVIIGPNGAGKTSLFRAMLGEIPHTGQLRFVHSGENDNVVKPRIGYVPQRIDLDATAPVSVLDLFAGALSRWPLWLGHRSHVRRDAMEMLRIVEAEDLIDRSVGKLSCGQLQRVLLALALNPVPDLLLLDEPIAGVDKPGIRLFHRIVSDLRRNYDLSILMISHDLTEVARVADRMIFLHQKILCDGPPREVLVNPIVQEAFGMDVDTAAALPAHATPHDDCEEPASSHGSRKPEVRGRKSE
jgi:zinc transport system ATP-binding protein